jgi:hypothetical protein
MHIGKSESIYLQFRRYKFGKENQDFNFRYVKLKIECLVDNFIN